MFSVKGAMELGKRSLNDSNEKIRWNPSLRVEILPEDVFLFSEKENFFLSGRIYLLLSPLLQEGKYNVDELIDVLKEQVPAADLYYAISRLEKKNLIQEKVDLLSNETAAFCSLLNVSEIVAAERLRAAKVFVHSFSVPIDTQFLSELENWGMTLVDTPETADFSVVFVEDYLQPELTAFSRLAFARKHPWMPVRPYGSQVWIGPFFHSDQKGCYECLRQRLKTNRLEESWVQQKKGVSHLFPPSHAMLSTTAKWAWNLAATEILKRVVTGKSDALANKLLTFDFIELGLKEHVLTRLSYCSCCSEESPNPAQNPPSLILQSRQKREDDEGGYRCLPPEETLKKYAHLVSPITGVVHFLQPSPQTLGSSIHVYTGGHNKAVACGREGEKVKTFRSGCGGKGITDAQAKVGCLCESLERFSGEFQGDERRIQGSLLELGEKAIDPESVLLFSQLQYLDRDKINLKGHRFHRIPKPFSTEMQLEWTPIWSLTEQKYKYYPTPLCYYCYPMEKNKGALWADSNGCAAGNYIEEAILQGFFELVERDSVCIWWYNRLQRPCVDLRGFKSPFITSLLREYGQMGREVWVLDITSDLGIPSFAAISRLKNSDREAIFFGFGTHLDPYIGVIRALTGMNQFLAMGPFWEEPTFAGAGGENAAHQVERDWFNLATVDNQPWLKGSESKSVGDFAKWESVDLLEDIKQCQNRVESQGMEVLILDQTRQEVGLSVVKVIVPGMRHFWPRFAPGRLYDVPVKMGWLKEPRRESELNPIGMFL